MLASNKRQDLQRENSSQEEEDQGISHMHFKAEEVM
jgi:hypothetical protein